MHFPFYVSFPSFPGSPPTPDLQRIPVYSGGLKPEKPRKSQGAHMTSGRREGFYIGFSSPSGLFFVLCLCLSATIVGRIQQLGRAWTGPCLLCSPTVHQWGWGSMEDDPAIPIVQDSDWLLPVSGTFSWLPLPCLPASGSGLLCWLQVAGRKPRSLPLAEDKDLQDTSFDLENAFARPAWQEASWNFPLWHCLSKGSFQTPLRHSIFSLMSQIPI